MRMCVCVCICSALFLSAKLCTSFFISHLSRSLSLSLCVCVCVSVSVSLSPSFQMIWRICPPNETTVLLRPSQRLPPAPVGQLLGPEHRPESTLDSTTEASIRNLVSGECQRRAHVQAVLCVRRATVAHLSFKDRDDRLRPGCDQSLPHP
jgi:hypothetical protein